MLSKLSTPINQLSVVFVNSGDRLATTTYHQRAINGRSSVAPSTSNNFVYSVDAPRDLWMAHGTQSLGLAYADSAASRVGSTLPPLVVP